MPGTGLIRSPVINLGLGEMRSTIVTAMANREAEVNRRAMAAAYRIDTLCKHTENGFTDN